MPRRKQSRLRSFDYATPGAYFVTICAHRRQQIFGCCVDGELRPTPAGLVIGSC